MGCETERRTMPETRPGGRAHLVLLLAGLFAGLCLLTLGMGATAAFADDSDCYLSESTLTLGSGSETGTLYAYESWDSEVVDVSSSDTSVVSVSSWSKFYSQKIEIALTKKGSGSAKIVVTYENDEDEDDSTFTRTCKVTCKLSAFKLNSKSMTFNKKKCWSGASFYKTSGHDDWNIVSAKSSRPKVATAKAYESYVEVTPIKPGKATVTAKDSFGRRLKLKVKIAKSWTKANLKYRSGSSLGYGEKNVYVYSRPGAKVTVKIGGRTYSKRLGKKGWGHVNVKKIYKCKTKFTVKYRYKKTAVTKKDSIYSRAYASYTRVYSCNSYVSLTAHNVTKGDTVILKAGGKTYRHKMEYSTNSRYLIFYTKKLIRNYHSLKFTIKNKYGQTLYKHNWYLPW